MTDAPEYGLAAVDAADPSNKAARDAAVPDAATVDTPPRPAQTAAKPPRRSVVPVVLGGVVAALIGFGVAQVVPQGWPLAQVSVLSAQIAAQSQSIADLQTKLADLANVPAAKPDPALSDRLAAVEAALASLPAPADTLPLTQRLDALEQKLAAGLPAGSARTDTGTVDPSILAQLQSDIAALKSGGTALDTKIAEAAAQLDSLKTEAQAVVAQAASRAALHQLQAALDSGASYMSALNDLPQDLPEVLKSHAMSGLPSLPTLRAAFPPAARAALDASLRASAGESWTERVSTFLRGQTGARSLTPRAGTDPDAVLSRAEAAIGAGDIAQALTELAALPQAGKDAMADWLAQATLRQDAVAALQTLSAGIGQ